MRWLTLLSETSFVCALCLLSPWTIVTLLCFFLVLLYFFSFTVSFDEFCFFFLQSLLARRFFYSHSQKFSFALFRLNVTWEQFQCIRTADKCWWIRSNQSTKTTPSTTRWNETQRDRSSTQKFQSHTNWMTIQRTIFEVQVQHTQFNKCNWIHTNIISFDILNLSLGARLIIQKIFISAKHLT